jgi:hypothetical protein
MGKIRQEIIREIRVIRGQNHCMKHEEITKAIIGAAMAVLNELKPGLDEKLYENALVIELVARGHTLEQQREYPVHYKGHFIGKLSPDLTRGRQGYRRPEGGERVQRHAHCPDARLSEYHRTGSGGSPQLQGIQTDLEAGRERNAGEGINHG